MLRRDLLWRSSNQWGMSCTLFAAAGRNQYTDRGTDALRKVRSSIISQLGVLSCSLGPKISSQVVELSDDVIIIYVVGMIFW